MMHSPQDRTWKKPAAGLVLLVALLAGSGCATDSYVHTKRGAAIGAVLGGVTGAVIGHQSGRGAEGAAIGAGVGGILGGVTGSSMDEAQSQRNSGSRQASSERAFYP